MRVFVYFQCFFVMPGGRNVIGNLKFWLGDRIGIRDRVMNFTGNNGSNLTLQTKTLPTQN